MQPAFRILNLLLGEPIRVYPWPPQEVARRLGILQSTVYRHMANLRNAGLVARRPGGYILGRAVLAAGVAYYNTMQKFNVQDIKQLEEKIYG